ncbi:MAG: IS30 family transposase [Bacteroidales bacterium]|nr:IS30 family transposase [Bacteroidales bacterium]
MIEDLIQEGKTQNYMAEKVGCDKSTISRELARNRDKNGIYCAESAKDLAQNRCQRERFKNFTESVIEIIRDKLVDHWAPEQISVHLKEEENVHISYELIYQYLEFDREQGGDMCKLLPHRGKKYKKRNTKGDKKKKSGWKTAKKRKSIEDRPSIVAEKTEIGHWEGDTVESKNHQGGIGTFVDITSKFLIMRRVKNKSSMEMKNAIVGAFEHYPDILKTMTLDNGTEFALHDQIEKELNTKIYFAHPYSPGERGLNENTNGLIRKFYPKGTDFSEYTDDDLLQVQNKINNRPRKSLNYKTPKEVLYKELLLKHSYSNILKTVL